MGLSSIAANAGACPPNAAYYTTQTQFPYYECSQCQYDKMCGDTQKCCGERTGCSMCRDPVDVAAPCTVCQTPRDSPLE